MKALRREFTFIVRMRREDGASDPQWRGSVHEVSSDTRRFVTTTRDIAAFIAACLHAEDPPET